MDKSALQIAIKCLGSESGLARAIKCSPQVVNNWVARGAVSIKFCPAIEAATNGKVRCEDLRPDVQWSVLRKDAAVVVFLAKRHPQVLAEFEQSANPLKKAA